MTANRTTRRTPPPAADVVPHCAGCTPHITRPGAARRADGHVYINRATVAECAAVVAPDRAANDTARAARAALPTDATDAARAAANAAVKSTGDRVWRTRNPGGHGGTVTGTRAARRAAAVPTVPPAYHSAAAAVAERLTAAGVPTAAADVAAAVDAHVAAYVAALNVGTIYAATLTARRDAITAAIAAATA